MSATTMKTKAKHIDRCGVTRKIRFKTHESALVRAGEIMAYDPSSPDSFRAYKCVNCGGYHLTSR